jgi:hypothetical protein
MNCRLTICLLGLLLTVGCGHKSDRAEKAASLNDLNRALAVVAMRGGTSPPSTNELAEFLARTGKSMPVPPPGKKLMFDSTTRLYILADQ